MPRRFRKKPTIVDAVMWTGDNLPEITEFVGDGHDFLETGGTLQVWNDLHRSYVTVQTGDWLARGDQPGDLYPIAALVLETSFEPVEDD